MARPASEGRLRSALCRRAPVRRAVERQTL